MDPLTTATYNRRASYIIPPIHIDEVETQPPQPILDNTAALDEDMSGDSVKQPVIIVEEDVAAGGSSSLRVKFKNKVNHTLASMRSSSNLREKAKTQHSESTDSSLQPEVSSKLNERRKSALSILFSEESRDDTSAGIAVNTPGDSTPAQSKNRQSKISWTFPRVRLEPNQGSRQQIPWGTVSDTAKTESTDIPSIVDQHDTVMDSAEAGQDGDGSTTLHQQLEELKVDELDSDHSLDIILPVDYEDYTQFAELPLKKRKKMERSLASNLAVANGTKRPNSMRASADVMRRFLTLSESSKKNNSKGGEDSAVEAVEALGRDTGAMNSNKKRPQASTESGQNVSKKTGQQAGEWRRSILKTLHLGKGQHNPRKQPATASAQDKSPFTSPPQGTALESVPEQQASQSPDSDTSRLVRSGSVRSTRSRSLTTSTHPALLATTLSKPRGQGLRRETLEMAMQRRRQSSAARSNFGGTEIPPPLPLSSEFFGYDNISTTNITHTFTSFTLELADMHHAHEVINNSAVPGLFNFKRRQPRLTMSSNIMDLDTDQEFKGFDSDGDAISGYTGDADVSMDDIQIQPRSPTTPRPSSGQFKARARLASSAAEQAARRKISSVDGDSDTVPELPTLMIRTRDLNRSNNGRDGGGYSRSPRPQAGTFFGGEHGQQEDERDSPRSPRRAGATSPTGSRKTNYNGFGLGVETTSPTSPSSAGPSSPSRASRAPMSMEEIASWKPRNMASQGRPHVPILDTKPLKVTRGSGLSSSTTLVPSSRTPYSDTLTDSPMFISSAPGAEEQGPLHSHQPSLSTSSSHHYHHQSQISGETLVPYHLKNFSSGSAISASSGLSAQTLGGSHSLQLQIRSSADARPVIPGAREFDPNEEFSPTTPADLKAMDFEALLATAEREHQKGWEDLMASKRNEPAPTTTMISTFPQPPSVQPLKISSASKGNRSSPQAQQQQQQQRNTVAFDLGPSDDGTGTGTGTGSDRSTRSRRVMKKKMSVIRLTGNGNVQGRREDDGVIRVSMSSVAPSVSQHSQQQFWRE
ncbi:hypothetical protein BGZ51_004044 [Haplosporangium sp. Z 767]|nr:hypothetical protein BGZ51_004044 [Haplosporangium sp. Z 767]